jgi:hypothetical protein
LIQRLTVLLIVALAAVNLYFAATAPCPSAEAVVYSRYLAEPFLQTWNAPFDPHIGGVYPLLGRLIKQLVGVSELSLRLPAVLGGLLFWIALLTLARRWLGTGWQSLAAVAVLAANPWMYRAFSAANGRSLAWGLMVMALCLVSTNLRAASLFIAIAAASDPIFLLPAAALMAALLVFFKVGAWRLIDEFFLPGILLAAFLTAPALLSKSTTGEVSTRDLGTRDLVKLIPVQPAGVRVGSSGDVEPAAAFYRRRYHLNWLLGTLGGQGKSGYDYYLLSPANQAIAPKLGLQLVAEREGVGLFRRP